MKSYIFLFMKFYRIFETIFCCEENGNMLKVLRRIQSLRNGASGLFSCSLSTESPAIVSADAELDDKVALENSQHSVINPLDHDDFFGVKKLFTMRDLFNARVHLGHKEGVRNEHMKPYIFGTRLGVDIIDLEQTVPLLQDALNMAAHVAYREGIILFFNRLRHTMPIVEKLARDVGEYSHCRYWKGGTFTNSAKQFGSMTRLPDLCIFLNCQNSVFEQHLAVVESAKLNIPTVGIVDTGSDPRLISYRVPGNDDTPAAIELYCKLFKQAILAGKQKRKEMQN